MAFNSNIGKQSFIASSGQTDFTFNFKVYSNTDLKVYQTPSGQAPNDATDILTITTDYAVVIDGDNGGTITLLSGATLNDTLVFVRDLPLIRTVSYVENGDLNAETLNIDQDYQTYLVIDKSTEISNTVQLPKSVVGVSPLLPAVIGDAYFKWNTDGTAIENDTAIPDSLITVGELVVYATNQANTATVKAEEALAYRNEAEVFRNEAEVFASTIDPDTIVSVSIHSATEKTTPVDADELGITDSTSSFSLKKLTFTNLKATLFNATNIVFGGTSQRIKSDFSNATASLKTLFQSNTTNGDTYIEAIPNGTSSVSQMIVSSSSNPDNSSQGIMGNNGSFIFLRSTKRGTGSQLALHRQIGSSNADKIDTDGSQYSCIAGALGTLYPEFKCRAWGSFSGAGSITLKGSGNQASVVRSATGTYVVTMTTAMPDVNYAVNVSGKRADSAVDSVAGYTITSTTSFTIYTSNGGGALSDFSEVSYSVHR